MADTSLPVRRLPARPRAAVDPFRRAARAAGFWLAVVLPFAYLAALVVAPSALADPVALFAAVGVDLLALVAGHGHEPTLAGRR